MFLDELGLLELICTCTYSNHFLGHKVIEQVCISQKDGATDETSSTLTTSVGSMKTREGYIMHNGKNIVLVRD